MKTGSTKTIQSETLHDEALGWIARLASDQVGEGDLQSFSLWLAADENHKVAYDEATDLWLDLGVVKHLPFDMEATGADQPHKQADGNISGGNNVVVGLFGRFGSGLLGWRPAAALAASITLAITLIPSLLQQDDFQSYHTAKGEIQSIELSDGSRVTLNTNTRIEVRLNDEKRRILLQQGEAFFEVAKDSSRPFIVNGCSTRVGAVGTAFNVRCVQGSSSVAVTEGIVEVSAVKQKQNQSARRLLIGQTIDIDEFGAIGPTQNIASDMIAPWRNGELIFNDALLGDVLDEINRYSNVHIGLGSPKLLTKRVSGRIPVANSDVLVKALELILSLKAEAAADGTIRLTPAT